MRKEGWDDEEMRGGRRMQWLREKREKLNKEGKKVGGTEVSECGRKVERMQK